MMAKFVPSSPGSRSVMRRRARVFRRVWVERCEPRLHLSGTGNLVFDDEFNQAVGSQPNTADWDAYLSADPNNQAVKYVNNSSTLGVVADPAATDGHALAMTLMPNGNGTFNSSEISTQIDPIADNLEYGEVSARIKLPSATNAAGIWPAFWMLGNNLNTPEKTANTVQWPEAGEVDIMENKGSTPSQNQGSLHAGSVTNSPDYNPTAPFNLSSGVFSSSYHVFAMTWTPTSMTFSVDGSVYETQNISSSGVPGDDVGRFNHPFFLILDVNEGGAFAGGTNGTQFTVTAPTTMDVDYVRVSGFQLATSPFTVPNSPSFTSADIGSPGVAGSASFDGVAWTVAGSGGDIFNTSDQFQFASTTITGNVTIVTQINTITNSATFAKAGIMIRDGTAANASYAFTFVNPNNSVAGEGANFEFRNGAGTASQSANSVAGMTAPLWLKLVRSGNTFSAFYSANGSTWTQNGPAETIPMGVTVNVGLAVSANTNSALNTATFTHTSILPGNWINTDIGSPNGQGSAAFNASTGVWTVDGGGADIGGTADQFNLSSVNLADDCSVIAQVTSLANTNAAAKAGVMLRSDTTAGSLLASVDVTASNGVIFEWRSTANTNPTSVTVAGVATPAWVKLTRTGNSFSGFYSTNGTSWTQIGVAQTINMNSTAMAGLSVSAHDNFALNQATFTNVAVLPSGWSDVDINAPLHPGSVTYDSSVASWIVSAGGTNISGTSDQFNFASQSLTGDGSIVAQVTSQTAASDAGIMLRTDTTSGSAFANVDLTSTGGVAFQWRATAGAAASAITISSVAAPQWLELMRSGNGFAGFYSSDGITWTQIGTTQIITMPSSALAGLAASAHNNNVIATADFTSVSIITGPSFASQIGSTLNLNFDKAADPIAVSNNGSNITVTENGVALNFSSVNTVTANFVPGNADSLNINGSIAAPLSFVGAGSTDALNINAGLLTLAAPASGAGIVLQTLGTLSIAAGAQLTFATALSTNDRTLMVLSNFQNAGLLDLGSSDLILHNSDPVDITSQIAQGYNSGFWTGTPGITSSAAAAVQNTALGVAPGGTIFDGQPVSSTDVVVKYTFFGDANLDGQVDSLDYALIDNSVNEGTLTGWQNGDFNYDNKINGDDYSLIDNAFNTQSSPMPAVIAAQPAPAEQLLSAPAHHLAVNSFWSPSTNTAFAGQELSDDENVAQILNAWH
jgi:beta-glucanase (GH16 family)